MRTVLVLLVVAIGLASAGPGYGVPNSCWIERATIVGTPGSDRIVGPAQGDVIQGGSGNDVILGRGGHDIICGGGGADVIRGASGGEIMSETVATTSSSADEDSTRSTMVPAAIPFKVD